MKWLGMKPVDSKFKVTQGYGAKSKLYKSGMHKGVDFGVPVGTPVYACVAGVVTDLHWGAAFGNHIILACNNFADGTPGLWLGFMHLSKIKVKPGQKIKAGQIIGYSGASGHVTGPHLHVEVQKAAHWNAYGSVNPAKWIAA
jgi:murein DD-endopeptidase MepM/ murein hydrolase activator NlpD